MALGQPSINTPSSLQLVSLQQTIANIRERFRATDTVIASLQGTASQTTQQGASDLTALRRTIATLTGRVTALEDSSSGTGGGDTQSYLAAEAIVQGAPVWLSGNGEVSNIDPDEPLAAAGFIGIAAAGVAAGGQVIVARRGLVDIPGAAFTPGRALYAEAGGVTHEPAGNALPVGVAVTATRMSVAGGTLALTVPGIDFAGEPFLPVTYALAANAIDLAASFNATGAGLAIKVATNEWAFRTLAAGDGITVADADGIAGDPTLAVARWADIVFIDDVQVLTGKSMSGADNTFSAIPQSAVVDLDADLLALQDMIALLDGELDAHIADTSTHGVVGDIVGTSDVQTLTNKTIDGAANLLSVRLDADVVGDLPVTNLGGGIGADATTFWRGDGTWAVPAGGGAVDSVNGQTGAVVLGLGDLDDVDLLTTPGPADGDVLAYDALSGLWVPAANSSAVAWGAITGTLADQTDLQAALDAKLDDSQASLFGLVLLATTDAADAQASLDLVPGTDVQAYSATLALLAGLTPAADRLPYFTGAGAAALATFTAGGRALVNSAGTANTFPYFSSANTVTLGSITAAGRALLDDADAAAQRTTLGLGTMATQAAADYLPLAGGVMTGLLRIGGPAECLRLSNSVGFISGYNDANTTRTGYLQFNAGVSVLLEAENDSDVVFRAGGSERMRISQANGVVGIGTTSPFGTLHLAGATEGTLVLQNKAIGANFGSWRVYTDGAAAVTIGTINDNYTAGQNAYQITRSAGSLSVASHAWYIGASTEVASLNGSGFFGLGGNAAYQMQVRGVGQLVAGPTDAGAKGASLYLRDTGIAGAGQGGALLFGAFDSATPFAAIKGFITNATPNTQGDIIFSTRRSAGNTSLTEAARITVDGLLQTNNAASLIGSLVALTNAAGAAAGTLGNAPTAGNPTKWIQINDAGTIRKIPTWT